MNRLQKSMIISFIWIIIMLSGFYTVTATAFEYNPGTYTYFYKIVNMPNQDNNYMETTETFWKQGGDCDDRALAFYTYLESKKEKNIHIVRVYKMNTKTCLVSDYGHCFVEWNGKIYDPMKEHPQYAIDVKTYQNWLKKTWGFNLWCVDGWENKTTF